MMQIVIYHHKDLIFQYRQLLIDDIELKHFAFINSAYTKNRFIAYENGNLLKILQNPAGACVTMPVASFLMAVQMVTKQEAVKVNFPPDMYDNPYARMSPEMLFKLKPPSFPNIIESDKLAKHPIDLNGLNIGTIGKQETPYVFIKNDEFDTTGSPLGIDPARGEEFNKTTIVKYVGKNIVEMDNSFDDELIRMHSEAYRERVEEATNEMVEYFASFDDAINSSVATAIEQKDIWRIMLPTFPKNLYQSIILADSFMGKVYSVMFEYTEVYFTSMFPITYPDIYKKLSSEFGFWCPDTELFKNLSQYGCKHEACMINVILKGIYRFRKALKEQEDKP